MKEFDLIKNIKSRYGLKSLGDDCAVLPNGAENDLLMTADLLIEGIDFELNWTTAEFIGHKALAVSLSDIAAMGGRPTWAMLSLGIPVDLWNSSFVNEFYEGWHSLAGKEGVELVGGDISRSPDKLVIDSIVCGTVSAGKAILRSGAKPGHSIFVSGMLGGAAGGLKLLLNEAHGLPSNSPDIVLKQLHPEPQLRLGNQLCTNSLAAAMIDLSDGLSSDLHHLIEASGVGAELDLDSLPIHSGLSQFFDKESCRDMALNGGEDFELLFTCQAERAHEAEQLGCKRIGSIMAGPNIIVSAKGEVIESRGFRHF
jgi:thiamine-monophosphate kinase